MFLDSFFRGVLEESRWITTPAQNDTSLVRLARLPEYGYYPNVLTCITVSTNDTVSVCLFIFVR